MQTYGYGTVGEPVEPSRLTVPTITILHPCSAMPNYRRLFIPNATWFFTVNLQERRGNDLLVREIDLLRESVRKVKRRCPFEIIAWVVLPEHMHCLWQLPENDHDYSLRWRLIKSHFSRQLPQYRSAVRRKQGERGIWQRHYWEHYIRDEADLARHIDYIHMNPVKHGWVSQVRDWPYSSFHHYVSQGVYSPEWYAAIDDGAFGE
ncbi:MAG: transposase [Cardiobacteriaceae bacterium]|nr:transposase [Cardiobacteriaceae bacterium]